VLVLGWDVKNELFDAGVDPIGQVVKIKNVPFEVIGVTKKQGTVAFQNQDDQVYIPLVIGQKQLLGINYLQFIRARVDVTANVKPTIADIEQVLRERHRIHTDAEVDFSVRDLADAIKLIGNITDALKLFLAAMAALSLVVGGIGIMNIMLVTVAERTREIGLRKAVGATNNNIRNQFLLEQVLEKAQNLAVEPLVIRQHVKISHFILKEVRIAWSKDFHLSVEKLAINL
jgi:putative ABC transport system permease protein